MTQEKSSQKELHSIPNESEDKNEEIESISSPLSSKHSSSSKNLDSSSSSSEPITANSTSSRIDENEKNNELKTINPALLEQTLLDNQRLMRELETSSKEYAIMKDKYLRAYAEMQNTQKFAEKKILLEKEQNKEKLVKLFLPIYSDFKRCIFELNRPIESKDNLNHFISFSQGVEMIFNKMTQLFEKLGLKEIEALFLPFNASYHDVLLKYTEISQLPLKSRQNMEKLYPSGISQPVVVEIFEPGYVLENRVVKPAKVAVLNITLSPEQMDKKVQSSSFSELKEPKKE